jgi:hypothetical protein
MKSRNNNPLETILGLAVVVAAMVATGLLLNALAPGVWQWIARNSPNGDVLFVLALGGLTLLIVIFSLITKGMTRLLSLVRRNEPRR